MATLAHEELEVIEREIKANLASPSAETVAFLNDALKRLRVIPFTVDPQRRIKCLIDIASQFYHQGQNTFNGVEPAALAVMLARDSDDRAFLEASANSTGSRAFFDKQSGRCDHCAF